MPSFKRAVFLLEPLGMYVLLMSAYNAIFSSLEASENRQGFFRWAVGEKLCLFLVLGRGFLIVKVTIAIRILSFLTMFPNGFLLVTSKLYHATLKEKRKLFWAQAFFVSPFFIRCYQNFIEGSPFLLLPASSSDLNWIVMSCTNGSRTVTHFL